MLKKHNGMRLSLNASKAKALKKPLPLKQPKKLLQLKLQLLQTLTATKTVPLNNQAI